MPDLCNRDENTSNKGPATNYQRTQPITERTLPAESDASDNNREHGGAEADNVSKRDDDNNGSSQEASHTNEASPSNVDDPDRQPPSHAEDTIVDPDADASSSDGDEPPDEGGYRSKLPIDWTPAEAAEFDRDCTLEAENIRLEQLLALDSDSEPDYDRAYQLGHDIHHGYQLFDIYD